MNRIKEIRKSRNMTQAELASRAGISRVYLVMIENGQQANVTVKVLADIAHALETSISALFA